MCVYIYIYAHYTHIYAHYTHIYMRITRIYMYIYCIFINIYAHYTHIYVYILYMYIYMRITHSRQKCDMLSRKYACKSVLQFHYEHLSVSLSHFK